jgi:hypothetical protein
MRHAITPLVLGSLLIGANAFAAIDTGPGGPEAKGVVDVVLQHGITGAMLLIVLYMYWRKDKQAADENAARVADSKANGEGMRLMVEKTTTQMERFNDTAEALVREIREERHSTLQRPPPAGVRR